MLCRRADYESFYLANCLSYYWGAAGGTAGAPFVNGKPLTDSDGDWKLTRVGHVEHKLGYCVVDVDGNHVKFVFKAESSPGVFEPADSFEYSL